MELSYAAVCFDLFGTLVTADGTAIAGAQQALESLPRERWAIVTSCGASFARALLAAAGLPDPGVLISNDAVERGKPSPDPYLAGLRALGAAASEAVAVEDSASGIQSARSAGLDTVAILAGRGIGFARLATYQVERFGDIGWSFDKEKGSIHVRIEP